MPPSTPKSSCCSSSGAGRTCYPPCLLTTLLVVPSTTELPVPPLTPALLRRLTDSHYQNVFEADFKERGELWEAVEKDEEAFWRGDIVAHPSNDWQRLRGQEFSYYAHLMEDPDLETVFLYCVFAKGQNRLVELKRRYDLGATGEHMAVAQTLLHSHGIKLSDGDARKLVRSLMQTELAALEDITARDQTKFDDIVAHEVNEAVPAQSPPLATTSASMSALVEKYTFDAARERDWPKKTVLRKKAELAEFIKLCGDKPVNQYTQADGVTFKDAQGMLPANRLRQPFKGLSLAKVVAKAKAITSDGGQFPRLSPITINDKLNTASGFFEWARARDASVSNPVATLKIKRGKNQARKNGIKFTIDELNRLFSAPVYTGCLSERHWNKPGNLVLADSAFYWVPLIGLFSGLRLGEIIQLQTEDVKMLSGITYLDVTTGADDCVENDGSNNTKSLKTSSSQRGVPVHSALIDMGFCDLVARRRSKGALRLFGEFKRSADDDSWSKQFSKHFKRFRESVGVIRPRVNFHTFRHTVEDALRNTDVRKEVRDAVQGHGENGVSSGYGTGYYLETLSAAVQKIEYQGLELNHLIGGCHRSTSTR